MTGRNKNKTLLYAIYLTLKKNSTNKAVNFRRVTTASAAQILITKNNDVAVQKIAYYLHFFFLALAPITGSPVNKERLKAYIVQKMRKIISENEKKHVPSMRARNDYFYM